MKANITLPVSSSYTSYAGEGPPMAIAINGYLSPPGRVLPLRCSFHWADNFSEGWPALPEDADMAAG